MPRAPLRSPSKNVSLPLPPPRRIARTEQTEPDSVRSFLVTGSRPAPQYRGAMKRVLVLSLVAACSMSKGTPGQGSGNMPMPDAGMTIDPNKDTDGDGVPDVRDNCPTIANADQADHDSD